MTTTRRTGLALAAALLLSAATSAPALAFDNDGVAPPPPPPPPVPGVRSGGSGGGRHSVQVGGCHLVSSGAFMGLSCGTLSGGGPSWKELLGSDTLPTTWHVRMTAAERDSLGLVDQPPWVIWYWSYTLTGIDPKTLEPIPGRKVEIIVGYESFGEGPGATKKPVDLTEGQKRLVRVVQRQHVIPDPILGVAPTSPPRVNQPVAFYTAGPDDVTVDAGGVEMRARLTGISVEVEGTTVSCPGTGRLPDGADPAAARGVCGHTFERSSAGEPDAAYRVPMVATWVVEYRTGGPWTYFNTVTTSSVNAVRVTEIQSLVLR